MGRFSPFGHLFGRLERISPAQKCPHLECLPSHELIEPAMCDLSPKLDCRQGSVWGPGVPHPRSPWRFSAQFRTFCHSISLVLPPFCFARALCQTALPPFVRAPASSLRSTRPSPHRWLEAFKGAKPDCFEWGLPPKNNKTINMLLRRRLASDLDLTSLQALGGGRRLPLGGRLPLVWPKASLWGVEVPPLGGPKGSASMADAEDPRWSRKLSAPWGG